MNISDLLKTPAFRAPLTRLLFANAEDPNIGCLVSANEFSNVIESVADPNIETVILGKIVDAVLEADRGQELILAIKSNGGSLVSYGFKLGFKSFTDVNDDGETFVNKCPAIFGSSLPEDVRLQVKSEEAGSGEYTYQRPVAQLLFDMKNAKGKTITAVLETGILDTSKAMKVEYREWVAKAVGLDEDDLIEQGLIAEWATPKLGSSLGSRTNLVDLGILADQFGPATYQVVAVKRIEKAKKSGDGFNSMVEFELARDGESISTWAEMLFNVEKDRFKGGICFGDIVEDALECGAPQFLHVFGSKGEVRYNKVTKKHEPYIDATYGQRMVLDGYLSSQGTIPAQLLRGVAPQVQALPQAVNSSTAMKLTPVMKSAAPEEEDPNFDDIPF